MAGMGSDERFGGRSAERGGAEVDAAYRELVGKLDEIFQTNRGDLDFGVYRILNVKREEVMRFLNRDLLPQVREVLRRFSYGHVAGLEEELAEKRRMARELGLVDDTPEMVRIGELLESAGGGTSAMEKDVYSHLFNFFRRYYRDGDFLSLRRYKEGVYAIPYSGEEVKLHWANHDQYYVKSAENFNRYVFRPEGEDGRCVVLRARRVGTR